MTRNTIPVNAGDNDQKQLMRYGRDVIRDRVIQDQIRESSLGQQDAAMRWAGVIMLGFLVFSIIVWWANHHYK